MEVIWFVRKMKEMREVEIREIQRTDHVKKFP